MRLKRRPCLGRGDGVHFSPKQGTPHISDAMFWRTYDARLFPRFPSVKSGTGILGFRANVDTDRLADFASTHLS